MSHASTDAADGPAGQGNCGGDPDRGQLFGRWQGDGVVG
jgi:hypothetical protein